MWETIIVNPFTNVLLLIYKMIGGNFGIAIILFTILIRVITHPLMASQIKSSTKMTQFQQSKQWQDIQKKYKGDKEKLAQEQMNLYKELGISPFASCLPSLVQIPTHFWLVSKHHARPGCFTRSVADFDPRRLFISARQTTWSRSTVNSCG